LRHAGAGDDPTVSERIIPPAGDPEREETIVERPVRTVETVGVRSDVGGLPPEVVPPSPYPGDPLDPAVVSEHEQVHVHDDGTVTRQLDRVEQPPARARRGPGIVPALLIVLALALGAIAAAWYFTRSNTVSVPSVQGLALDAAVSRVESDGLEADIVSQESDAATGTVFRQDPTAGTDLDKGASVQLFASKGPASVTVPNTVGVSETDARDRLAAVGLKPAVTRLFSDAQPSGSVVSQDPTAGGEAAKASTVKLTVSKGPSQTTVPSLVGLSQADAVSELTAARLKANVVSVPSAEASGTVVAQHPTSGQAPAGSTVRLNVSSGS
jgi:eukaryotic-like serine/threonine-protein kinase